MAINHQPIDRFTLGHLAMGVVLGAAGAPFPLAIGVAVGWEFAEVPLKKSFPQLFPHPSQDTLVNAVLDAVAVLVGWGVVRGLTWLGRDR